jgi:stage V sporulation protein B
MKSSLGRGALYLSLSSVIFMASGYLINIWLGKTLGPVNYGTYGIVITLMSLINIMQTAGTPQAVSKFVAGKDDVPRLIFGAAMRIQITTTLILTVLFISLAYPLAIVLNDKELLPYLLFSAAVLPFYGLFSLYLGYYNGLHYFRRQALMNNIYSLAKLGFVILLTIKFNLYGAIAGFIISPIIALVAGARDFPPLKSNYPWRKLFRFSLPLIAFAITSTALLYIALFILKAFKSNTSETIGYYVAAQNIAMLPYYALNAIALVLLPGIALLTGNREHDKARKLVEQSLRYALLILIPSSLMLAVSSKNIIQVLFSAQYVPGHVALQILTFGYALLVLFTIFTSILSGAGCPGLSLKISFAGLIVAILSCLLLIPNYGLEGAAWGTTIGAALAASASFYYINKNFNVSFPFITFFRCSVCAVVASSPLLYLNQLPALLIPGYLLSIFIYTFLLILTKELTLDDRTNIRSLLPTKMLSPR